jgi:hypothetical protein
MAWPDPDKGQTFAEAVAEIPRHEQAWAIDALRTLEELAEPPDFLALEERQRAAGLIQWMLFHYPGSTPAQLLWILAADAFRPHRRGRRSKWAGVEGGTLVELVEAGLRARGLARSRRKELLDVCAEIRGAAPDHYGGYSAEALRKAYYAARRAQSGKSAN